VQGTCGGERAFRNPRARNAEALSQAARRAGDRVGEMAVAMKQIATIADEADRISREASEDARSGDEVVATLVDGMKKISVTMENTARVILLLGNRSREIGKVLEVIETSLIKRTSWP
jgi:methyl-accepting chemotaxis protein